MLQKDSKRKNVTFDREMMGKWQKTGKLDIYVYVHLFIHTRRPICFLHSYLLCKCCEFLASP